MYDKVCVMGFFGPSAEYVLLRNSHELLVHVALYIYLVRQIWKHDTCLQQWFSVGLQSGKYNGKLK